MDYDATLSSQILEIRPAYHRLSERSKAHVSLCWLGLLLIRVIENQAGQTWKKLRRVLEQMHIGEFTGPDGHVFQRTETTVAQKQIFKFLNILEPPLFFSIETLKKDDA